jgi:hypothetical protein
MEVQYKGVIDKLILVKLTSRSRPKQLIHTINECLRLCANPKSIKWLISLDHDDESCNNLGFIDSLNHLLPSPHIVIGHSLCKIHAINRDIETFSTLEHWDILLNLSDDQCPITQGWDNIIRDAMPNDLDASLWFWDEAQNRINTMEILGYNYYMRDKNIYDPRFKSFYCDNYATMLAEKRGKLINFNSQCLFRHNHPACQKPTSLQNDELYNRNQKYWNEDEALFNSLKNAI